MGISVGLWPSVFEPGLGNAVLAKIKAAIEAVAPMQVTPLRSVTGAVTLTAHDYIVIADMTSGDVTITLPLVSDWMIREITQYVVKREGGANTLIIQGSGGNTIDGTPSVTPAVDNTAVWFAATTGGWRIVG